MRPLLPVLLALAVAVLLWWWWREPTVPNVAEIRARQMDYEAIKARLTKIGRIENPAAYGAALFRRAYGRNP